MKGEYNNHNHLDFERTAKLTSKLKTLVKIKVAFTLSEQINSTNTSIKIQMQFVTIICDNNM